MNHLDLKSKYNIYRIVQEFVTNSIKYANCTQIDCDIYSKENTIYLEIKDNGMGFDLEKVKKGMGLNNMHKRAFLCGAKLDLVTSKERGTKLVVLF
jgi:signal transduction histidine kinase